MVRVNQTVPLYAGCDKTGHADARCWLLPQATLTLNLLQQSQVNPKLSAYAQLNGLFDSNQTPLAPPGIKILIHEKSQVCHSWAPYRVEGWFLGPALDHYRCYQVYCAQTGGKRILDTVEFFPHDIPMPKNSSIDIGIQAAQALTQALLHPTPASPLPTFCNQQVEALQQLANISTGPLTNLSALRPRHQHL
jgi:hypothetical protein